MRKYFLPAILISAASASWALTTPNMDPDVRLTPEAQIDTVNNQADTLQSDMESTLLGKDDIPLAVSGYMTFRFRNSDYSKVSPWTESDKARSFVDAFLNVSVVAMPNSYMTLWTNMCFPFDLSGIYANSLATQPTNAPRKTPSKKQFLLRTGRSTRAHQRIKTWSTTTATTTRRRDGLKITHLKC